MWSFDVFRQYHGNICNGNYVLFVFNVIFIINGNNNLMQTNVNYSRQVNGGFLS